MVGASALTTLIAAGPVGALVVDGTASAAGPVGGGAMSATVTPTMYVPVAPIRIVDTRSSTRVAAGSTTVIDASVANGIPGDGTAVAEGADVLGREEGERRDVGERAHGGAGWRKTAGTVPIGSRRL